MISGMLVSNKRITQDGKGLQKALEKIDLGKKLIKGTAQCNLYQEGLEEEGFQVEFPKGDVFIIDENKPNPKNIVRIDA